MNPEPYEEQEDEPPPEPVQPETAPEVQGHPPYMLPGDAYYPYGVGATPMQREPSVIYPDQTDLYRYPPLTYPDDVRENQYRSSDSDVADGKDRHRKKKSKKSKKKKEGKSHKRSQYDYYADGSRMIGPDEAVRDWPVPEIGEEPFESYLPVPAHHHDHYVIDDYDPAWHYNMKSYIRDQQQVNGFTDGQQSFPYESHIDEFPPADYNIDEPYNDGPYERRLPVTGRRTVESDHQMLNSNFIMRQRDDYLRRP